MNMKLISNASELQLLRTAPEDNYMLIADIDLTGIDWQPADFAGTLNGNGHTVSNVTVAAGEENTGFFGCNRGTVYDLKLQNVTVAAQKGNVGIIAGENRGDMSQIFAEDCTITVHSTADTAYVGALVGLNMSLLRNSTVHADMTVIAAGGSVVTGGLVGKTCGGLLETVENFGEITLTGENICVGLFAGYAENTKLLAVKFSSEMNLYNGQLYQNHFGQTGVRLIADGCIWRDNRNSDRLLDPDNLAVRSIAEQHMRRMGSHAWSPSRKLHYLSSAAAELHEQEFLPGVTYYGPPYDHKHISYEEFLSCFREDGSLQPWLKAEGWDALDLHMGCDCSGAIYWAWSRVSPDIEHRWCWNMMPVQKTGTVKVGDYQWPDDMKNTREIKELNGVDVIREAMAQMHKGDVFLRQVATGGHVRMCAQNPVIYRLPNGEVDSMSSYAITHEQGDGLYPKNRHLNSSWLIDHKYPLRMLNATNYIPITTPVLSEKQVPAAKISYTGENKVNTGVITSNFRIIRTTVQVQKGEDLVWEKTLYTAQNSWADEGDDYIARTTIREVDLDEFNLYWLCCPLEAGETYTYTANVMLSTGNTYEAVKFDFVN